ncbi:DUF72 domain-containing protein [Bacillus tianshenii]|uniref:DUF72 domain-containing protein n=1 Tax=Sutcliffiella tianshenii TaxID=1463404 RepID=UPI001CD23F43|nr:DUF72 domain-containing protein [Bacillus tianshenii]MCA1319735.1 DUF72 domain-containing protein [Bacillus tianshenii]
MIYIGVTGWGDHDSLYTSGVAARDKLKEYSAHFPVVEVDSSFYAIQPKRNVEKWVADTPPTFKFIVKAYQGMTGHQRGDIPFESKEEMFEAFLQSIEPFKEADKLAMVLFQFPPWFDCNKDNVIYIRWCKEKMKDTRVALEFRNQSWFSEPFKEQTLSFMEKEGWIHSICDEPQAGKGSIPTVLHPTDKELTLVRLHGRNVHGWTKAVSGKDWREVRYLYDYNEQELLEWKSNLEQIKNSTEDIYVLFNNNSGGHAADNAKRMIEMLDLAYHGLAPRQLDLF